MSGLPGRGKAYQMASVRAGVVTAGEVNGPMANPGSTKWDLQSAATWAVIWFVASIVILFFVL